jgi:hypothetical protein
MTDADTFLDGQTPLTHEIVARAVLPRFPGSTLKIDQNSSGTTFDLYYQGKLVISFNKRGARYFFPSRRKKMITWKKITTDQHPRIVEYILRDLAQADFVVLSPTNNQIKKRPIHISRHTRCPKCKTGGGVKPILRGESLTNETSEIYTPISLSEDINWAEIKCSLCGWIGTRQEIGRRFRKPR